MKEASVHGRALQQAHGARVGVGKNRLRAVGRIDDGLQTRGDVGQGLVPRDPFEVAFALGAHPAQGMR